MKYLLVLSMLLGCGKVASTEHKVKMEGEAKTTHTVVIKFDGCDGYENPDEKIECLERLVGILEELFNTMNNNPTDGVPLPE
jgi:hypothetical protein